MIHKENYNEEFTRECWEASTDGELPFESVIQLIMMKTAELEKRIKKLKNHNG